MNGFRLPDMATSTAPAAVTYEATDFVAWKGEGSDTVLYYTMILYENGNVQSVFAQTGLPQFQTSHAPAMASFGGRLYLLWKGLSTRRIWIADGTLPRPGLGISWGSEGLVEDNATDTSPAMAGTPEALYVAWKGQGDDVQVWWSKSTDGKIWHSQGFIPAVGNTSDAPALAAIGSVVFLAWKGAAGDNRIFWSKCEDGQNWAPQLEIAGVGGTSTGPALGVDPDGNLRVVWKAEPGDDRIFFSRLISPLTNTNWSTPQQPVLDASTISRPALASNSGGLVWRSRESGIYAGLLDTLAPPLPQRPVDLSPANASFSNPVRLRWKDPAAGSPGQADSFQFYAAVNEVALLGNGLVVTGGMVTESAPVTFLNGQAEWGVQGVNVSGTGPFAVAKFAYPAGPPGPQITVNRVGNTNNFEISGTGFTPGGVVSYNVQTALATATEPLDGAVGAEGSGALGSFPLSCSSMCSSAHGGTLIFTLTDETTGAQATKSEACQ